MLRVIMIDPVLEQSLVEGLRPTEFGSQILHRRATGSKRSSARSRPALAAIESQGFSAVLVCAPALRPAFRRLVSAQVNGVPVLSYQEATVSNIQIETVGVVRRDDALTA